MRKVKDIESMVSEFKAMIKAMGKLATDIEREILRVEGPAGPPRGNRLSDDDLAKLGAMMVNRRNKRLKNTG